MKFNFLTMTDLYDMICVVLHISISTFNLNTDYFILYFTFRIFSLYPLRWLSSKLSTCVQLSYRTEHMRTISSAKPAAGHTQFMR